MPDTSIFTWLYSLFVSILLSFPFSFLDDNSQIGLRAHPNPERPHVNYSIIAFFPQWSYNLKFQERYRVLVDTIQCSTINHIFNVIIPF